MHLRSLRAKVSGCCAVLLLVFSSLNASALTAHQFVDICDAGPGDCAQNPVLNAYVGGALDLLATLQEGTDRLQSLYCVDPEMLFDVPPIIRYIEKRAERDDPRNAMHLFIRYFEEKGRCEH